VKARGKAQHSVEELRSVSFLGTFRAGQRTKMQIPRFARNESVRLAYCPLVPPIAASGPSL
jgi:hypothetical protein